MDRRTLLIGAGAAALLPQLGASHAQDRAVFRRVRPADAEWPNAARWEALDRRVGGRLVRVRSPLNDLATAVVQGAGGVAFLRRGMNPSCHPHAVGEDR